MTTLPESAMRRRWAHKRERTPKNKSHTSKGQGVATPKTVASIASDFCGDILSPIVGKRYEHNSSEDVTPTNSNDSETDTRPPENLTLKKVFELRNRKVRRLNSMFSHRRAPLINQSHSGLYYV